MAANPGAITRVLANYFKRNQQWARLGPWQTQLNPADEQQFQQWAARRGVNPNDVTYDNRGFWRGLMTGDPRAKTGFNPSDNTIHGPDTWKTPYHPSFSNESIYAMPDAPSWKGNDQDGWALYDKTGNVLFEERMSRQRGEE